MNERVKIGEPSEPGEYDPAMLALLQIFWGDGFLSPGGAPELARVLEGSDVTGARVLDIGCGLGAIDELLVTKHGAGSVVGIDIDPVLLDGMNARIERAAGPATRRITPCPPQGDQTPTDCLRAAVLCATLLR
jgi:phosphoethanolamine N-methyltransferase